MNKRTQEKFGPFSGLYKHFSEVVSHTWNYARRYAPGSDRELLNITTGLGAETGEVLDVIKKWYCHTDRRDDLNAYDTFRQKLVYELGDVLYYWMMCLDFFNISIEEVVDANCIKLESRHPELGHVAERFGASAVK